MRPGSTNDPPLRRPHNSMGDTKMSLMIYSSSFGIRNVNLGKSLSPSYETEI